MVSTRKLAEVLGWKAHYAHILRLLDSQTGEGEHLSDMFCMYAVSVPLNARLVQVGWDHVIWKT